MASQLNHMQPGREKAANPTSLARDGGDLGYRVVRAVACSHATQGKARKQICARASGLGVTQDEREGVSDSITRFMNVAGLHRFPAAVQLYEVSSVTAVIISKFTRSGSMRALAAGLPAFSSGTGRFTIGVTGRDGTTYHVHILRPRLWSSWTMSTPEV